MNHKRSLALVIIVTIGLVLLLQHSERSRFTDEQKPTAVTLQHPQTTTVANQPSAPDQAQRDPSAQLQMEVGTPSPAIQYPRGENQRRRYGEPSTHLVDPALLKRTPAMLAMLPADGRTELLPEEIDTHTLQATRLVLDTQAIERVIRGETARLLAPTPDNSLLELQINSIKTRSALTHTLIGKVAGEPELSDVLFVYHDGILHGSVARYSEGRHFEYRILADGHMMVRELDQSTMDATCGNPNDCGNDQCDHSSHSPAAESAAGQLHQDLTNEGIDIQVQPNTDATVVEDTSGWTTVDVVVGYDRAARIADGGVPQIEARILSAMDRMNLAFSNSLITQTEMMLLGTIEDPDYIFPGAVAGSMSTGDELGSLSNNSDGVLDTVTNYASQLGADFRSFILKQADGSAGIAYLPGNTSIVARDYMSSSRITFAHELGHNLGCDHSWGDSSQAYHNRYGWRLDPDGNPTTTTDRVRTIMAYDWAWGNGQRIPYYSNPDVTFGSARTGAVNGYNASGDMTADQRYVTGGLGYTGSNTSLAGFNGTNSGLGAYNALNIKTGNTTQGLGAAEASTRATRVAFSILEPLAASVYSTGESVPIFFIGGDHQYTATLELCKGGIPINTIASGLNPATDRKYGWLIPNAQGGGIDYSIRVTLTSPTNSSISAESQQFTITSADPFITSHTPTTQAGSISEFAINFSESMNPASFTSNDDILSLTGPQGQNLKSAITSTTWSNNNSRLTVGFTTQTAPGYYRLVIGPQILDLDGSPLDQDSDSITGEFWDDRYTALASVTSSGGTATIWSDMVGTDTPDPGWTFGGLNSSWATGTPTESPPLGPNASYDGGQIIAQNLSGSYNPEEASYAETPPINCSGYTNISIVFQAWSGAIKNDLLYIDALVGTNWVRIFSVDGPRLGVNDEAWTGFGRNLAAYADGNANFKLRWGLEDWGPKKNNDVETGWQIDSIVIKGDTASDPLPAPSIIGHSPSGNGPGPCSSIWIDFTNPMDSGGFSLGDITSFTGPSGAITPSGYAWLSSSLLRINFPQQSANGTYSMALATTIPDTLGNPLTSSYVANFSIGAATSPYETWAGGSFSQPLTNQDINANPDSDPFNNLLEFAFGTDPTVPNGNPIAYIPSGEVTSPGAPVVIDLGTPGSADYYAVFGRRKDYLSAGLTYAVSFSATLTNWVPTATPPVPLSASSGQIEAVAIPFPSTIDEGTGNVVPQFFKVDVTSD